jgi:hypothetical protein
MKRVAFDMPFQQVAHDQRFSPIRDANARQTPAQKAECTVKKYTHTG